MAVFDFRFSIVEVEPGSDTKLLARVSGIPEPQVAWFKDHQPITNNRFSPEHKGNSCALSIKSSQPEDAGLYSCVAKNREGEATSDFKLVVAPKV